MRGERVTGDRSIVLDWKERNTKNHIAFALFTCIGRGTIRCIGMRRLRQRRAPAVDPLLPLHSQPPSAEPRRRRRRKARKGNGLTKMALLSYALVVFLLCGAFFTLRTPSQDPNENMVDRLRRYHGSLTRETGKVNKIQRIDHRNYKQIKCVDGNIGWMDDDYCDCPDGADEPNTSACSHILVDKRTFACKDGSGVVFSSRVNDGVKDCADGSDEKKW